MVWVSSRPCLPRGEACRRLYSVERERGMRFGISSVTCIHQNCRIAAACVPATITQQKTAYHLNQTKTSSGIKGKIGTISFSSLRKSTGVGVNRAYHSRFRFTSLVSQRPGSVSSAMFGSKSYSTTHNMPTNDPVVSVEWLHGNIHEPDIKVLDASWYMPDENRNPLQEYQSAHIPGALFFDVDGISDRASNLPHMLPSEDAFAAAVTALGVENQDGIVVYDGKGIFSAARVWWMFRVFGHEKVWVLDGGLLRWRALGFDVESSASGDAILKASAAVEAVEKVYHGHSVVPAKFTTKFQPHLVWTLDEIRKNIGGRTHQHIDARSKPRFDGMVPEPRKGVRSGHVPGSVCIPFRQMLDDSQMLLPNNELEKKFLNYGISLNHPMVTSCGTGVTACILALGLHRLGMRDVPVYDGSWMEWGVQSDTPVSTNSH